MRHQALLLSIVRDDSELACVRRARRVRHHWGPLGRNCFGFEPKPSGPQPLRNLRRRPDGTAAGQLVGGYGKPILKQEATAIVKQKGELALAGKGFPNVSDQCRPYARLSPSPRSSAIR
jgi:hypothetical protein